jgi:hypothetical protein
VATSVAVASIASLAVALGLVWAALLP